MPRLPARCSRALLAPLVALVLAASASSPAGSTGQDGAESAPRPRIGLVLSGGGARGAAHIGVLEVLEELRVPVDFIVGTSMGAIVGGLYAAGHSPVEMRRLIADANWGALLSDAPPRRDLSFRRRQDKRRFQVDLELGWEDGGPVLPPGLLLGRNVDAYLERVLLPVSGISDFDQLRIPYRCVATDLSSGEAVVLADGNLARAVRASMSLPGIFAPVERDGRLLIDGGVVDNVPVDVARELGADILIVVDISTPLVGVTRAGSPLSVSNQVISILMSANHALSVDLINASDIAITPDLGTISTLAFERAEEAVEIGRAAALELRERIAELATDEAGWSAFLSLQRYPERPPPRIRKLTIGGRTRLSDRVIRRLVPIREGSALTASDLRETREALAGLGVFDRIEIDVQPVPGHEELVDVVLRPMEKNWGPHYLRFGIGISSDLAGEGEFDLGVQHTATPLNALAGEWRNELQAGTRTRLFSEFYQPLDGSLRWFVAPSVSFQQDNVPLTISGVRVAEVGIEATEAAIDIGRNLGWWGEARVGHAWAHGSARPTIAIPGVLPESFSVDTREVAASLLIDTIDSLTFPRRGVAGAFEWSRRFASLSDGDEVETVQGGIDVPITSGPVTVLTSLEGGTTLSGGDAIGGEFRLGGFRRLSGLSNDAISGDRYALAVVQPYYQLSERGSTFGLGRYIGVTLEYGGAWQGANDFGGDDLLFGGSAYLGLESLLGSVFLGVGFTEGGERAAYVFIGPVF